MMSAGLSLGTSTGGAGSPASVTGRSRDGVIDIASATTTDVNCGAISCRTAAATGAASVRSPARWRRSPAPGRPGSGEGGRKFTGTAMAPNIVAARQVSTNSGRLSIRIIAITRTRSRAGAARQLTLTQRCNSAQVMVRPRWRWGGGTGLHEVVARGWVIQFWRRDR